MLKSHSCSGKFGLVGDPANERKRVIEREKAFHICKKGMQVLVLHCLEQAKGSKEQERSLGMHIQMGGNVLRVYSFLKNSSSSFIRSCALICSIIPLKLNKKLVVAFIQAAHLFTYLQSRTHTMDQFNLCFLSDV